jgi:predicted HD phosphohydrolase
MSPEEAAAFEQDPLRTEKLRLRAWDEQAKVPGLEVPGIESYRALLRG